MYRAAGAATPDWLSTSTHPSVVARPSGARYTSQLCGSRLRGLSFAVHSSYAVTICAELSSSTSVELPRASMLRSRNFDHLSTLLPSMAFEASWPLTDSPYGFEALVIFNCPSGPKSSTSCSCRSCPAWATAVKTNLIATLSGLSDG